MTLHSKIPPAAQVLICAFIAYGLARYFPTYTFPAPFFLAVLSTLAGTIFLALALFDFRKHETTVNPLDVTMVSVLVTDGPYRLTRNPMYVGLALLLLALCVYLANLLTLLTVPLFVTTMTVSQIRAEEKALIDQFGDEYRLYLRKVSRWLLF
ncbi:MAG: methyltransferase family protein [Pikeienuella sp.]